MVKQLTITGKEIQKQIICWIAEQQPILLSEILILLNRKFSNFTVLIGSEARHLSNAYPQLLREIYENESWIRCFRDDREDVRDLLAEEPKRVWIKLTPRGSSYIESGKNPPSRHSRSVLDDNSTDTQNELPQQNAKLKIVDLIETHHYKYPPKHLTEERARTEIYRSIQGRRGQQAFREKLLEAYEGKCAITESTIESLLEAAHIRPYCGGGTFDESNGLLLRADIHTLFDLGLIAIDTNNMTVVIHPSLDDTEYGRYANRLITLPSDPKHHPNKAALDQHRREVGITI